MYWRGLVGVLALITIAAAFSPITNKFVTVPLRQTLDFSFISKPVFYSFLGGLRGSTTVAGFATAIKLVKVWYLKTEENKQLERGKLNAELEVLKNQLHPHFLFNTLNSIYLQALKGSTSAAPAIEKLSALLRYILTECKQPSIPLANEIRMLRNYIDLEKTRFGKRLDIVMMVHGDADHNTIAPLVLLPFLENAFKHGTGKALDQAWISVDITITNNELTIKLINAKSDIDSTIESPGIGLNNVRKRLRLLYPGRHELNIMDTDDMFVVDLKLTLDYHITPAPLEDKVSLG
ncbi:MAG: histidine kinase [Bacteroidia bacterium]|nr:histidine kinase [Bacteroidia bacterium]